MHGRPSLTHTTCTMHDGFSVRRVVVFALLLPCLACDTLLGLGQFTFDGSIDASDECVGPIFDPARVAPFLTADGGLPPLPPFEAGPDAPSPDASKDASDAGGG